MGFASKLGAGCPFMTVIPIGGADPSLNLCINLYAGRFGKRGRVWVTKVRAFVFLWHHFRAYQIIGSV
jgi:hypothetical protein